MKHLFLTIILNTCCILVFAQNFIDTSKVWSVASFGFDGSNWMPPKSKYLQFKGDTLIDNRIYAKLCSSDNREKQGWRIRSFMREETDGKIYTRFTWGDEFLSYDFNLQKGDTFLIFNDVIMVVDSVVYKPFGDKYAKHIYLTSPMIANYTTIWVEGIGAFDSKPDESCPGMAVGGYTKLICFEEQGELVYHNTTYSGCFINS
ncbi:MAG TPA: hypothetical protein PLK12_14770, partial [Prolixibacteraceae bacterium]|nr:hypothetical protein [Prolixibacteraceae bacterium]